MKKALIVLVAILALASAVKLWARPFTIKCPYDGDSMMFDHQVGIGRDAYCWYSHTAYENGRSVKHQAYVSCE